MNLNFFGDKHGKNARDTHFSCISKFIKSESFVRQLSTSMDIVDAINKRQELSNILRKEKSTPLVFYKISIIIIHLILKKQDLEPITTIAVTLQDNFQQLVQGQYQENQKLTVKNLESYYNYRTVGTDFQWVTSVLSDRENFMPMPITSFFFGYTHNLNTSF